MEWGKEDKELSSMEIPRRAIQGTLEDMEEFLVMETTASPH